MATVFIMGISLGVAVDDTSFFVHGYLDRAALGSGALSSTLRHNGPTMVATCLVIVIGFSVLLASSFTPMRTFGGLTAVGLVLAMLCDVFVSPFLLLAFSRQDEGPSIMRKTLLQTLLLTFVRCCTATAQADSRPGRDIARKSQVAQFTFKTLKASGEMTLSRGSELNRPARDLGGAHRARVGGRRHDQARITINAPTALKDTQLHLVVERAAARISSGWSRRARSASSASPIAAGRRRS